MTPKDALEAFPELIAEVKRLREALAWNAYVCKRCADSPELIAEVKRLQEVLAWY